MKNGRRKRLRILGTTLVMMSPTMKSHPEEREVAIKHLPKTYQIHYNKGSKELAKEMETEDKNDKEFLKLLKNNEKRPKTSSNDSSNDEITPRRKRSSISLTKSHPEEREAAVNIYIYIKTDPKIKYLPKSHQIYYNKGGKELAHPLQQEQQKKQKTEGENNEKFLKLPKMMKKTQNL
ncbi:hypothetical protein F8M41_016996 [Gigaspora margarita]|uniref:Uncharacterized protein n=1 Tax=Gigaspora margarita TaxID=4874 RepID=A0A8H4B370_GIGMA|nr:hypothetical protein F8M41_016996 [Gigaspora margarita]